MDLRYLGVVRFDSIPRPNQAALEDILTNLYSDSQSNRYYFAETPSELAEILRSEIADDGSMNLGANLIGRNSPDQMSEINLSPFKSVESYVVDDTSRNFIDIVSVGVLDDENTNKILEQERPETHNKLSKFRRNFGTFWENCFNFLGDQESLIDTYASDSDSIHCCTCFGLPYQWEEWDSLGGYDSVDEFFSENQSEIESLSIEYESIMESGCLSLLATGDIITVPNSNRPWQNVSILDVAPSSDIETPGWPNDAESVTSTTQETFYGLIPFFRAYRWGQSRIQDINSMEAENRDNLSIVRDTGKIQPMVDSLSEINAQRELIVRVRDEQSEIERFVRRLENDDLGGAIYPETFEEGRPEEYASSSNISLINTYRSFLNDVLSEFNSRFDMVSTNQTSTAEIVRSQINAIANEANVSLQDQIAESVNTSSELQRRVYVLTLVLATLTLALVVDVLWTPAVELLSQIIELV